MEQNKNRIGFLSGSTLKIIACVLMAIDHIGLELLGDYLPFRIIGRLAFPIFAFFIAEGCKYTKNKLKRFQLIFTIGAIYMAFYYFFLGSLYCNIFMTFSVSILLIYLIDYLKKQIFIHKSLWKSLLVALSLILALSSAYLLSKIFTFEYGFWGMIVPVCVSLVDFHNISAPKIFKALDNHAVRLILLTLALIPLSIFGNLRDIQYFCLFSLIPMLFYNGKEGNKKLKFSFYIFYPVHLIIIELIAFLINYF